VVFSLFENSQLNFLHFQKIDDDGQKMAKAVMMVYGIDQIDQVVREACEARKPQRFRPAQQLQQPTGRPGGVPRPFSVALRLAAPQHRACGDDSERRSGSSRVPRPVSQSCRT